MSKPSWWPSRRRRDSGMTLPEVLISITLMGVVMAALSAAIVVTLRQQDNSTGRLNNARSTQNVNLWMPTDLASADKVNVLPNATPCGTDTCPAGVNLGGSNALMLSWTTTDAVGNDTQVTTTNVSYRYVLIGQEYQLIRVRCSQTGASAWTCAQNIVLHDLNAPPMGTPFVPGTTVPSWIMTVSEPLAPGSSGSPDTTVAADPTLKTKNAKRVVVTINGGGSGIGGGGGQDQISISAGGTDRELLDKSSLVGAPTFVSARSRCGGNITLIVDTSGSIGSTSMGQVRSAIQNFVSTFSGTPVQLQVVWFSTTASTLGSGSAWGKYFNMLSDTDVASLNSAVSSLTSNGGTNWEDGWFRTFFNADGTVQSVIPDLVVFFTDGIPNYSRLNYSNSGASTDPPIVQGYPAANGTDYNQEAFFRANYIAQQFRSSVRFIGVGVGSDIGQSSTWLSAPIVYQRGFHFDWQRQGIWYEVSSGVTYQKKSGSKWVATTKDDFEAHVSSPATSSSTYRTTYSSSGETWAETTQADWTRYKSVSGWRQRGASASSWTSITGAQHDAMVAAGSTATFTSTNNYSSPYDQWETTDYNTWKSLTTSARRDSSSSVSSSVANSMIITRLIAGNDNGVPAVSDGTGYTNAAQANMYVLPNWNQFDGALKAVALAECGGTLTLQTKVGTSPAPDPFTYQNTAVTDSNGNPVVTDRTVVTTTRQFVSGTFDFAVPSGRYLTAEIQPQNLSDLVGYQPGTWACKAGLAIRTFAAFPIAGTVWSGIRVQVGANEAVSCTQTVTRTP
ncbi:MAG: VWA domain-containing protein [Ilumatobacteraceae bacterium]